MSYTGQRGAAYVVIQHNLAAINNLNVGNRVQKGKFKATERLSSGYRVNRAADDAAGLAISEKMRSRMRALFQVQNNIEDGISLTQTADGALAEVNDMLNRVQELCVQAANGTNTDEDRMMLADEITQLYDAMEAVFTDTEFNTIPIFRHDGANFYAGRTRYNYTETVTWLPDGEYASWGDELLGITDKVFDKSKSAVAASATIPLDDTINVSKASDFVGKNLKVGNCNFQFVNSANGDKTGYIKSVNGETFYNIDTNGRTVEGVLNQIVSRYNSYGNKGEIDSVSIVKTSNGKNALEFVMKRTSLTPSCTIDGTLLQYPAIAEGNGSVGNNVVISSIEGVSLEKVDTAENPFSFADSVTASFSVLYGNGTDAITADQLLSLKNNEYYINIGSNNRIKLSIENKIDAGMTNNQVRSAFVAALKEQTVVDELADLGYNIEASVEGYSVKVKLSSISGNGAEMTNVYIGEQAKSTVVNGAEETSHSLVFELNELVEPSPESVNVWTLTLDDTQTLVFPVTCQIGSNKLTIFDKSSFINAGSNSADAEGYEEFVNNGSKSAMLDYLKSRITSWLPDTVVTKNGNTLTIKSKTANTDLELDKKIVGTTVSYEEQIKYNYLVGSSYFVQEYSIPLDLNERMSSGFDVKSLYGSGFCLNGVSYEFSDAASPLTNEDTVRINIAGCDTYDAIAQKVGAAIKSKEGNNYTVANSSGVLTISGKKGTYSSKLSSDDFSDGKAGVDGLLNNNVGIVSVKTSGGTDMTRPHTSIDFSGVNLDNISDLYGKGFRITCATCPGEFVNVIFCHDKDQANFPPEFEYTDEDGNVNIIKNHVVELKNITSGNQIVDNIAQQLQGSLEHTITVEPDGASLLVMDKRYGDIKDMNDASKVLQAKILAGVYTNCTYHVDAERIVDASELVGDGRADTDAYYAFVMIYAGDTEEKPYIPVHLPYLSLDHLKLDYPGDSFQNYEGVTNVMRQAKTAASVISMARSKIGADQNRLEHAFQYAANAEEQVTASFSRIRDTDMAEETVNQAKYGILAEVQQAMLAQIYRQPEQVLSLLR